MKNIVIWGFHSKSCIKAINILNKKQLIDIKAWIGNAPECTHDLISFIVGDFKKDQYHGNGLNIYNEIFYNNIHQFMDMMSRHSFYAEKSFHDYLNIFNLLFELFFDLLIKNNTNIVLFSNLPHEGPDLLLYKIAKKLNIKTILCYQTIFPDKFFYLFDINDFGNFTEIELINKKPKIKIEEKYEKELFYMANVKQSKNSFFSLNRSSYIGFVTSLFSGIFQMKNYLILKGFLQRSRKFNVSKSDTSKKTVCQNDSFNISVYSWHFIFSLIRNLFTRFISFLKRFFQRYSNYRESKKNLSNILTYKIDLNKKFVYFPLHLQPELTTSALGGVYLDQLLAIERLCMIIPEDWFIYVKENPKQTELMRGKWFFKRLSLINNTKVVAPDFNTYSLMENCIFIATITGTAGWEAISGGKKVLVFGNPWYKSLPGVFSYHKDFKLEDILNYKLDHSKLETELNTLISKAADGVIDESYSVLVENFSINDNAQKIATLLEKLINQTHHEDTTIHPLHRMGPTFRN